MHLIFFEKRRVLVNNYNDLVKKFEKHKHEVKKELKIKDEITQQW